MLPTMTCKTFPQTEEICVQANPIELNPTLLQASLAEPFELFNLLIMNGQWPLWVHLNFQAREPLAGNVLWEA